MIRHLQGASLFSHDGLEADASRLRADPHHDVGVVNGGATFVDGTEHDGLEVKHPCLFFYARTTYIDGQTVAFVEVNLIRCAHHSGGMEIYLLCKQKASDLSLYFKVTTYYVGFNTGNGETLSTAKQSQTRRAAWLQLSFSPFPVLNPT